MSRLTANILLCCAALVWGGTFVAQKTGMDTIGPMAFTASRYAMGAMFLLPLAFIESRKISLWDAIHGDRSLTVGSLALGLLMFGGMALQQTALVFTSVANTAFLTALYVPLVPLIAALFLRRIVSLTIWAAVILSLLGSFLLSGTSASSAQLGDVLTTIGAFFWAGHILLTQSLMTKINAPFQFSLIQASVTAFCAAGAMLLFEMPSVADFLPAWRQIMFAGVVSVGIGFTLQLVAQRHTTAAAAALILSLESVFAAIFGWLLIDETLGLIAMTGCGFIFLAIIIAEVVPESGFKQIFRFLRKS